MERRDQVDASGAIDNRIEDMLLFDYTSTCSIETKLSIIYYHLKKQKQKFLFFFVVFQVSFNIFLFFLFLKSILVVFSLPLQSLNHSVCRFIDGEGRRGGGRRESLAAQTDGTPAGLFSIALTISTIAETKNGFVSYFPYF